MCRLYSNASKACQRRAFCSERPYCLHSRSLSTCFFKYDVFELPLHCLPTALLSMQHHLQFRCSILLSNIDSYCQSGENDISITGAIFPFNCLMLCKSGEIKMQILKIYSRHMNEYIVLLGLHVTLLTLC